MSSTASPKTSPCRSPLDGGGSNGAKLPVLEVGIDMYAKAALGRLARGLVGGLGGEPLAGVPPCPKQWFASSSTVISRRWPALTYASHPSRQRWVIGSEPDLRRSADGGSPVRPRAPSLAVVRTPRPRLDLVALTG